MCTHNRQKLNTHSKHTNAHTELPQRNHVFELPSLKGDTAVEHRGRERGGRRRQRDREREGAVVRAGETEGARRAGFQRIWIEFNSGIRNNCMSSSCHGKPRQLCWRPPRLRANTLPSQAQEVMSRGRTPGLPLLPAG